MRAIKAIAAYSRKQAADCKSSNAGELKKGQRRPKERLPTLAPGVTRFDRVSKRNKALHISLESVINEIRNGVYSETVQTLRQMKNRADRARLKQEKLPAFCPAGELGKDGKLRDYQNRVVIDVDGIPLSLAKAIRESARDCPECMAGFLSPSGGVKLIFFHDLPESQHKQAYNIAKAKAVELKAPVEDIDTSGIDSNRLCYLSCDAEAFFKDSPIPLRGIHTDIQTKKRERGPTGAPLEPKLKATRKAKRGPQIIPSPYEPESKLDQFWKRWISEVQAVQGGRNHQVVKWTTFLFHAVSERILTRLLGDWYQVNRAVFDDSFTVHKQDIENCLKGVRETWQAGLSPTEREAYESLKLTPQVAFRILRDLGRHGEIFSMSYGDLAGRITGSADCYHGKSLLEQFQAREWLKMVEKGNRWKSGRKRTATTWTWIGVPPSSQLIQNES